MTKLNMKQKERIREAFTNEWKARWENYQLQKSLIENPPEELQEMINDVVDEWKSANPTAIHDPHITFRTDPETGQLYIGARCHDQYLSEVGASVGVAK